MTFSNPGALWLLALAVPIVAVHLYRGRLRRLEVPTLVFWDAISAGDDTRSALRRLRHLAGLIAALAALAVLTSAVADPTVAGITLEPRRFAVVVDTSPEMTPERLTAAKAGSRDLLARLGRRDTAAILDGAGVVEPPTDEFERRLRALDRLPRSGHATDPGELLESARAADPGARIFVFTARPWPPGNHALLSVGSPQANGGLASPRLTFEAGRASALATAVNASDRELEARLEVRNRGQMLASKDLKLAPRERREVRFDLDPAAWPDQRFAEGAFIELRLKAGDPRAEDDAATFVVPPDRRVPVVVVAEGDPDPHLLTALDLLEQAKAARVLPTRAGAFGQAQAKWGASAVYVFDRVAPPRPLPDGGHLILGALGPAPRDREVEGVKIVDWDRDASVHRWVDYADVKLKRAWVLRGEPLVTSDRGPVAVWGRRQGQAWIQFGFGSGVEEGDFALTPSFPILLRNAVAWLADEGRRAFPRMVAAGGTIANLAPLADPEGELEVTELVGSGVKSWRIPVRGGEARIPAPRPCLLEIEGGGHVERIAVQGDEPVDLTRVPQASGGGPPDPIPWWRDLPYAVVAAAVVLALLAVEWLLYQRGWI
jgi:hypothetical protein